MSEINTLQVVNPIYSTNANLGGARANIHMADEGYLLEQRNTRQANRSFSKGLGEAVTFGINVVDTNIRVNKQIKAMREKEAELENRNKASEYLDGLKEVTAKYREDNKGSIDPQKFSAGYQDVVTQYTQNAKMNMPVGAMDIAKGPAEHYVSQATISNYHLSSTNKTKANVAAIENRTDEKIRNASMNNFAQDLENFKYDLDTKAIAVPVNKDLEVKNYIRRYKMSQYSKEIVKTPTLDAKKTYLADKDLDDIDKETLASNQATEYRKYQSQVYDNALGQVPLGTLTKEKLDEYKGILNNQQVKNLMSWQRSYLYQKKVDKNRIATEKYEKLSMQRYNLDPESNDYEKQSAKIRNEVSSIDGLTHTQMMSYDSMVNTIKKNHTTVTSMSPNQKADRKTIQDNLNAMFPAFDKFGKVDTSFPYEYAINKIDVSEESFLGKRTITKEPDIEKQQAVLSNLNKRMDDWYTAHPDWTIEEAQKQLKVISKPYRVENEITRIIRETTPKSSNATQSTEPSKTTGESSETNNYDFDAVTQANKNLNFVKRVLEGNKKRIKNKDGSYSTHLMATVGLDNKTAVLPTIVEIDGKLKKLPIDKAVEYAKKTGEFILFDDPKEADAYAKNGLINHNITPKRTKVINTGKYKVRY